MEASDKVEVMDYEDWLEANTKYDSDCRGCGTCAMYYNDNRGAYDEYLKTFLVAVFVGDNLWELYKQAISTYKDQIEVVHIGSDYLGELVKGDVSLGLRINYSEQECALLSSVAKKDDLALVAEKALLNLLSKSVREGTIMGVKWRFGPNMVYLKNGTRVGIELKRPPLPHPYDDFVW